MIGRKVRSHVPRWLPALALMLLVLVLSGAASSPWLGEDEHEGRAPTPIELTPGVDAAFPRQSYGPGDVARLAVSTAARRISMQIFRVGAEGVPTVGNNEMQGVPVTDLQPIGPSNGHRVLSVPIGQWATGLYFARLNAVDGRVGFAPFVVRPAQLGGHRVAVVLPTLTWQAYNLRDDDHDGTGDTWYANWHINKVRLGRPFLNRGVPPNFRRYDLAFLHWLVRTRRGVDFLSDADLRGVQNAAALAKAYDLIIFPGHHEYVTTREYDIVQGYRDLGGNLAFLSANNFFWRLVTHGDIVERTEQWRDLGRPEAALIGNEYRANDSGHFGPWIVRDAAAAPWLFAGTGLENGSEFGMGGIEIDSTAHSSPPGTHVLAEIPDVFGPGYTAQMTYYETPAGAKVFAAGAFSLASSSLNPPLRQFMDNLYAHLAQP